MTNWLSIWHLLLPLAVLLIIWQRSIRRQMLYGGVTALPVLLLMPILSPTVFELFDSNIIMGFFLSQALIVFSLGVVVAAFYERVVRPQTIRLAKNRRYHYLLFGAGFVLSIVLFDLFNQPLLPSLIFGLGLNLLLAIRYQAYELTDLIFSTILMGLFYVFIYAAVLFDLPGEAGRFWFVDSLSGSTLFGLAIEKIVTIFAFGLFWGPLYVGLKDVFSQKN